MLFIKVRIHRILAVLLLVVAMVAVAVPPDPNRSHPRLGRLPLRRALRSHSRRVVLETYGRL